jgi:lipopolysaccharide transport system permease protein
VSGSARFSYLLSQLVLRDLRTRYRQTLIGALWGLGRPLAELFIFVLVFGMVLKAPSDGLPYPLFAYTGVVLWTFVSGAIPRGTRSITAHAGLVSRVPFPKLAIPLATVASAFVDLLVAGLLLIALMAHYHYPLTASALSLVPILVILAVFVTGVTVLGSALHVFYHDLGYAADLGLRLWQLATPIAYASSAIPARWQPLYQLNPLVSLFDAAREALLRGQAPPVGELIYPAVAGLACLAVGLVVFRSTEPYFAESV